MTNATITEGVSGILLAPLVLEVDDEHSFDRAGFVFPVGTRVVVTEDTDFPHHLVTKADQACAALLARQIAGS